MSKIRCLLLLILAYLFGYIVFTKVNDLEWMPEKSISSQPFKRQPDGPLLLRKNQLPLKNRRNGILVTALPNSLIKKLDLNTVVKKLIPSQKFIQVFIFSLNMLFTFLKG